MYQAAIGSLLGLRRLGNTFTVDPCLPAMWPAYSLDWKYGGSLYRISVENPEGRHRGVRSARLDGVLVNSRAIPLHDDGGTHDVAIVLGAGTS
jgi:cellobiose phosphorylase